MYIYRRQSSGSQNRRGQQPIILLPSQRYYSCLSELAEPPTLAEKLRDARKAHQNKQEIFKILRQQPAPFSLDASVRTELLSIFAQGSSELWLAERLARFGPEPLWPLVEIKARVNHALNLGFERGNFKATLEDPNPGGARTGSRVKCLDSLKRDQLPEAFFFPGRTDRRALIISGVHGDERRGVEVVKDLQILLEKESAKGNKPLFSTILVPAVIPRTQPRTRAGIGARNVPGGLGFTTTGTLKCRNVEPNRNFPLPGEDLAAARARGQNGPDIAELMIHTTSGLRPPRDTGTKAAFFVTSIRMLPETRILISLIERFQPERLASIHDHSLKQECHPCIGGRVSKCGGEGPGIFVDPRGIDPVSNTVKNQTEINDDDALARKMAEGALTRLPCNLALLNSKVFPPFAGNQVLFPPTVRYFSEAKVEGNSLGDWAPVPTSGRPGIATLTIEIPKYGDAQAGAERIVKDLHRDLLQQIFLEI
jgi:hypothetical protein